MRAEQRIQSPAPADPGSPEPDDSTLLRLARSGDRDALDALCRRSWRPVYRSFARLTADPAEAEDLTREVFVRALGALPHFEDRGLPYTAYLLRIAGNLARDQWRAGPARPVVTGDIPDLAAPGPGPDSLVIDGDRRQLLLAALDQLTPSHRQPVRLGPGPGPDLGSSLTGRCSFRAPMGFPGGFDDAGQAGGRHRAVPRRCPGGQPVLGIRTFPPVSVP